MINGINVWNLKSRCDSIYYWEEIKMKKGTNLNPFKGSSIEAEPIRGVADVKAIENLLSDNPRNLALFVLGTNTGLCIEDLLKIKIGQVLHIKQKRGIRLNKSGSSKKFNVPLNNKSAQAVHQLIRTIRDKAGKKFLPDDHLFSGTRGPLTVSTVNNLVKKWCAAINLKGNYDCHSLRKTYGYQKLFYDGGDLSKIMSEFNHTTLIQTLDYVGVLPSILEVVQESVKKRISIHDIGKVLQKTNGLEKENVKLKENLIKIKNSEKDFRVLFENASDGIVYANKDGRITRINDRALEMFGYDPGAFFKKKVIGKHYSEIEIFSPEAIENIRESIKSTVMGDPEPRIEIEARRRDGTITYVDVTYRLFKQDRKQTEFISIARDISDRKKMEEALRESEETARALLNATTDMVMLLDEKGIILDVNKTYADNLQMQKDELIGLCLWDRIHHEESDRQAIETVFRTGRSLRFEKEYQGLWLDNVVYPISHSHKNVSMVAVFSHDITRQKQAEQELLKHRDHLEDLVKERTIKLEETNAALKVLLQRREEDRKELEERVLSNVKEMITPHLENMKSTPMNDRQKVNLEIIEANLKDIISSFSHRLTSRYFNFTPAELQIAGLIKYGRRTKEIAEFLNLSVNTVKFHRSNIRNKLGLSKEKSNLRSYLQFLD